MQAFWNHMAQAWPIIAPEPILAGHVGADVVAALHQLRLLVRQPLRAGARYPCDGCSRGRVVVEHEGAWAVCTCGPVGCEPVDVSLVDRVEVNAVALVERVRKALQLAGPAEEVRWNRPARLGDRRLGVGRVVFGLVARPRCVRSGRLERWVRRQRGQVTVLFAPTRSTIPTDLMSDAVVWLSLEDVVDLAAGTADLSELAMCVNLSGAELAELLWPRFALVADEVRGRFFYAARPLGLERSPRLALLLRALVDRPSEWVTRRELVLALYPDEITNRGRLLTDPVKLERRLRQLVSDLGKAFRAVDAPALPTNPVENLRARSDLEGGYRLMLPPDRVFIHSGGI